MFAKKIQLTILNRLCNSKLLLAAYLVYKSINFKYQTLTRDCIKLVLNDERVGSIFKALKCLGVKRDFVYTEPLGDTRRPHP